jgi:hypothetical protein
MSIQDRCTICGEHVVVKEIILGLPDGTPRWHGSSGSSLQFARIAPNIPRAKNLFWQHSMDLRGDLGQMEARFGPFGYSVNLDAR